MLRKKMFRLRLNTKYFPLRGLWDYFLPTVRRIFCAGGYFVFRRIPADESRKLSGRACFYKEFNTRRCKGFSKKAQMGIRLKYFDHLQKNKWLVLVFCLWNKGVFSALSIMGQTSDLVRLKAEIVTD